ncbi:MAG: NAD(P)-binding domain-containing protein [Anaerolineae bacterium]|nr:NAD(P)-binding domain-containing protein [Anaerolineae bacterium]
MTVIYREFDADPAALEGCTFAVLGYGNMGRSVALNLRDSGLNLVIGNLDDEYGTQAYHDGFEVKTIAEAARDATVKLMLMPDEAMAEAYLSHIAPTLKPGDTLVFASGYNVTFGFIEPPPFVDVILIAPRTIGAGVREGYNNGQGFLSFVAVGQDTSGKAWDRLLALALALGTLRAGAVELTFRQEAELDLFVQQAFLPALHSLLFTAAELLVKEGYPAEAALLDLYISGELSYTLDKARELGLRDTLRLHSLMGQYGMLSRSERFQEPKQRRQMEIALEEIRGGKFAQEWAAEYANGYPRLEALRRKRNTMPLWELEQQTIALLRQVSRPDNFE